MNTKRIMIIGSPGSGKSTFARKLRDKSGLPLFYLDMINLDLKKRLWAALTGRGATIKE